VDLDVAKQKSSYWQAKFEASEESAANWRGRCEKAESERDEIRREFTDALKTAGDSMALRLTSRRMFSKDPAGPPPDTKPAQPIGVSRGSGKAFARDRVRQRTAETLRAYFEGELDEKPDAPKPN
jgi:hypothetical protein